MIRLATTPTGDVEASRPVEEEIVAAFDQSPFLGGYLPLEFPGL